MFNSQKESHEIQEVAELQMHLQLKNTIPIVLDYQTVPKFHKIKWRNMLHQKMAEMLTQMTTRA